MDAQGDVYPICQVCQGIQKGAVQIENDRCILFHVFLAFCNMIYYMFYYIANFPVCQIFFGVRTGDKENFGKLRKNDCFFVQMPV